MRLTTVDPPILTSAVFEQLYRQYAGQLLAYLIKSLRGDKAEAEGIVQEAFLKAWKKRTSLRDVKAFRSWIYSIALNELRQRKRKLRPLTTKEIETTCERPLPEQHVAGKKELERVMAALNTLPDDQREAILLVRIENMKFREVAEILKEPENTIKTRVRRGLLNLTEKLGL
jgi:RNA polymerase sigma-70 factor (ECF subfamily)